MSENRKLDADGVHANMDDELFELAVESPLPTPMPAVLLGSDYSIASSGGQETNNNTPNLLISIKDDNGGQKLEPGSYGTMTFYFVPKVQQDMTAHVEIEIKGFDRVCNPVSNYINSLLQGHILLFQRKSDDRYSNRIDTKAEQSLDYSITSSDLDDNGRYTITIYWVWPQTVSKLLYQDGALPLYGSKSLFASDSSGLREINGEEDNGEPVYTGIRARMKEALGYFFFYNTSNTSDNEMKLMIDNYPTNQKSLLQLSSAYNLADQEIGDNVVYLMMEVKVTADLVTP